MSRPDPTDSVPAASPRAEDRATPIPLGVLEPLLVGLSGIQPAPAANAALKARILARARADAESAPPESEATFTIRAEGGEWVAVAPGVQMKPLRRLGEARTFLLKLEPGGVFPAHRHDGDEECIVLEGEVFVGSLRVTVGDYHLAPRGTQHEELTSPTGALLFLRTAAAVALRP